LEAVIPETFKTAPKFSPKAGKLREKVAETAEISKTAPKIQLKSRKNCRKKLLKLPKSPNQLPKLSSKTG
jgi:hypothetical protein